MNVFDIIVCAVDESPEALAAVTQAERLRTPLARMHLVTVEDANGSTVERLAAPPVLVRTASRDALARALEHTADSTSRLVEGDPVEGILAEASEERASVIVVGSHGPLRLAGTFLGSTAAGVLRRAPVSVLVARRPRNVVGFPSSIAVGVDGSPESRRALAVARDLSARHGARVRAVTAPERDAVEALVGVSAGVDLLVLGARGLHGADAIGSVAWETADRAFSSVLVVR